MPTPQQTTQMQEVLQNNLQPFLFEEHNQETWDKIADSYYALLNADVNVEDFAVQCNEANNTQDRIAAGELWVDVAIKHNGDDNFTYYPIRVKA